MRMFLSILRAVRNELLLSLAICLILISNGRQARAYSVLTHEEIIDLVWNDQIRPLLLARFPGLTEDQIKDAHAYAYGGAVIQDLGYYPFGSKEFSDLVHYVRSGDFVLELLHQSQDVNEYAFALGALSHYAADLAGHPAVNQAVAIAYPKLRAKFGKTVLYAQAKTAHIRTEFGFDMAQVAKERYAPQQYHDFIGFNVSKELLERTFPIVYGVQLTDVLAHEDLAIGSFRYAVSSLIPHVTQAALRAHKKDIMRETPNFNRRKFLYRLSRSDYEKSWGTKYEKTGLGVRFMGFLLRFVPKIGPFKALDFKIPTPKTEDMYFKSINMTVDQYKAFLEATRKTTIKLPDYDLDTGKPTVAAEYTLADDTCAKLLSQVASKKFDQTTVALKNNILAFYTDAAAPMKTKENQAKWQKLQGELDQLKAYTPDPNLMPAPPAAAPQVPRPVASE